MYTYTYVFIFIYIYVYIYVHIDIVAHISTRSLELRFPMVTKPCFVNGLGDLVFMAIKSFPSMSRTYFSGCEILHHQLDG